jgi:DNA-binding CsgD family transcriptional regulator
LLLESRLGLTTAEAAVAYWLPFGLTVEEIAKEMGRSPSTVKGHLEHITRKTGTTNARQLASLITGTVWWVALHGPNGPGHLADAGTPMGS